VNAIRDQVDLCRRCTINALQHLPSAFGHKSEPPRETGIRRECR
jgi:hypothetical protein